MTQKPLHTDRGFTLLEITVIIGVIGALLAAFISFYKPTQTAVGVEKSRQQVEFVLDALARYTLANNRLPCPANPTEDEDASPNNVGRESVIVCGNPGTPGMGIVPYRTLGLDRIDVQDGFERYLTYVVYQPATAVTNVPADSLTSLFCAAPLPTAITVRRNGLNETDNAYAAIIAYGPEGIGAYSMSSRNFGARNTPIPDTANMGTWERENRVDFGSNQVDIADYSTQEGNNHFDDTVGYMTGPGMISRLGTTYCR